MSLPDWVVLFGTLGFIVIYGVWKTRGSQNIESYLKGDNQTRWWAMGISIRATQASAVTFLSTPGQAYSDGMRFIQFYFGLPIAMIIVSVTFVPIFFRLKVFTAYEYLETRFDLKTRTLSALLFFVQRGLAAGITIYAPFYYLICFIGVESWSDQFIHWCSGGALHSVRRDKSGDPYPKAADGGGGCCRIYGSLYAS